MNKLKVGDLVRFRRMDPKFDGMVVKIVGYCESYKVFVADLGGYVEGKYICTHTCNGMFVNPNYLYLHPSSYSFLLLDNALNRLLYPELTPNSKGYLE